MVALAFRIPLPCPSQRILPAGYKMFRSLLLFKAATFAGAVMTPPEVWQAPLMQAYGYYFKAIHLGRVLPLHHSAVLLRSRKSEIYAALSLCTGIVAGLSQPLVDALHSELQAALAAETN
ncbi:hypothetical protein DFH09DRAFT_3763 [Mycena vulgaris]|nr:hypothetical protein DFH09DRAFT_3763 [Mycena vulgaris]